MHCHKKGDVLWKAVEVTDGQNCEEAGYEYIMNRADCERATEMLGFQHMEGNHFDPAPQGCYGVNDGEHQGYFSIDALNHGNGQICQEDSLEAGGVCRFPICKDPVNRSVTNDSCVKLGETFQG